MPLRSSRRLAAVLATAAVALGASRLAAQAAAPQRPRLIVFLTVDQMRPDYLERWRGQLTGGLARLSQHGAFFTNAFQEHGVTETAPGHSVTMSGRFPNSTGILRNTAGVEDPQAPLLTSRDAPASPYRFRGSVLIDWLRTRDARSRALSISRKDRGAILPMGRAKQQVFWYATSNGEFTTSRYYADTLPTWIRAVNARRTAQRTAGRAWTLLLPPGEYAEPDSVPVENNGKGFTFPHVQSTDSARAAADLPSTPWMDALTLDAALAGLQTLGLGTGPQTDILAVSLSATDYIGHRYGPDSREQHDNILRLDRALGTFIDSLYRLRDSSTIVFALTADHGVTSYPELAAQRAGRPAPVRYDLSPAAVGLKSALRVNGVDTSAITMDGPLVYVNRAAFAAARVDPEPILRRFADVVRTTPGIARVDRVRDLSPRDTVRNAVTRRWMHMIPPDSPVEWVITPVQGAYPAGATIAEHGAPYDDDAHVPVIFYGPWFRTARFTERALVADMAPTLAHVAGVPPTERVDGRVLVRALVPGAPR
ncbi:MAG: putative phosphatase [Gemmatimonadetes bacterium]|jgi:arylsulfatase A-like enzyme|nr:putative phosphatase [Gemmatimonadota bacterium]